VGLTTPAIKALLAQGIDVVFLTLNGDYCGRLIGPQTPHVLLRRKQYRCQSDSAFVLALAQRLVIAKVQHLRVMLQRQQRAVNVDLSEAIEALAAALERVPRTTTLSALIGVEGAASAAYFGAYKRLLKPEWKFEKRQRRPPPDPVNLLLSFGYTLLAHLAESAVAAVGLDPYAGFLHSVAYNRPGLALDLMEEFRPVIDGVVLWIGNSGQVTPADFTPGAEGERPLVISEEARRRFIRACEQRLGDEIMHPCLHQRLSLRQCLLAQARQIVAAVQSGRPEFTPLGFR